MNQTCIVYKHTNRNNGKSYVGWTSMSVEERWKDHCYIASRGSDYVFHRAIRKHGHDVWNHEVLAVCNCVEDALKAEVHHIVQQRTFIGDHPDHGYNMTRGGEGVVGLKWSIEQRAKHSGTNSKLSKLSVDDILALKRAFISGASQNEVAAMFGVSQPLVSGILNLTKYVDVKLSGDEETVIKHKLFHNKRKRRGVDSPFWGLKRSAETRGLQRERALAREKRKRADRSSSDQS